MRARDAVVYARIGDYGQEVHAIEFPWKGELEKESVNVTGMILEKDAKERTHADLSGIRENVVQSVTCDGKRARVEVMPFLYERDFRLVIDGKEYDVKQGKIKTETLDDFEFCETENGVSYRYYSPKDTTGPRPLILFLHGMGGTGTDNSLHMTECFGATAIAELYPWCYVMAPQLHPDPNAKFPNIRKIQFKGVNTGGWDLTYLAKICDIIRAKIKEGNIDPKRVYVTGLSMGGAGTIKCINVAPDLFAACVPICPSMGEDTYNMLRTMTHTKVWAVCSYVDHGIFRHKYITDAIMELKDAGNKDARLTIYGPDELAEFGIGDTEVTQAERIAWNHWCWVPVYKGDRGIMYWMMNQYKE